MRAIDADKLRQDVLDWEDCPNGFSDTYDKARIIDEINYQPTLDVEPVKHGHWEHGKEISRTYIGDACIGISYEGWHCSECDWAVMVDAQKINFNYCPNCGCRMDEVNDEDN